MELFINSRAVPKTSRNKRIYHGSGSGSVNYNFGVASNVTNPIGEIKGLVPCYNENKSSAYSRSIPANSMLESIDFFYISGTPTIRIGTTFGGDDILEETVLEDNLLFSTRIYFENAAEIYISVYGGAVSSILNYFVNYFSNASGVPGSAIDLSNLLKLSGLLSQTVEGDLSITGNLYASGNIVAYSNVTGVASSWWDAMPKASPDVLGGVKIGANLFIDADGVLSANAGGGGVSAWVDLTGKPAWLDKSTLVLFEAGHGHTWSQITGKPTLFDGAFSSLTGKPTTLAGYGITDASLSSHVHTFASLTSKPTTLSGYGITDASLNTHVHSFASLTSKPTTLAGFGITDASINTHVHTFASLTSKPTTVSGYGITDAALSGHEHQSINIQDTRAVNTTPNQIAQYKFSTFFTNQIGGDWKSGISVKGWEDNYATWQMIGGSSTGTSSEWYLRSGIGTTWTNLYNIWHSGNFNKNDVDIIGNNITASGSITATGNITAFSDERLKTNIKPIENALAKILQLQGVTYNRVDQPDKEKSHIGLVAQEVQKIFPELVETNSEGILSLNYQNMVAILVEAIKELNNK